MWLIRTLHTKSQAAATTQVPNDKNSPSRPPNPKRNFTLGASPHLIPIARIIVIAYPNMRLSISIVSLAVAAAAAAPDPLITPRAALAPRQNTDPALLGWVDATNGQCMFLLHFPHTAPTTFFLPHTPTSNPTSPLSITL